MTTLTRWFVFLLFFLFGLVGFSLGGSWRLRHDLNSDSELSSFLARQEADHPGSLDAQARLQKIRTVRLWTTSAQEASLLLCGIVCILGLYMRYVASREAAGKEEAETQLQRERQALENRIEDRTRQLRQEVEERRRAEEWNRAQKQVLEILATPSGKTTQEMLSVLTTAVGAQHRSWVCSLHLVEKNGQTLGLIASTEASEKLKRYLQRIDTNFSDAPESRAWMSSEPYVIDRMTDVRRPWSELLVANGILSAWSVPISSPSPGTGMGTLTVYSRLHATPSQRDMEVMETAGRLAALVLEHSRIQDELFHNAYRDALTELPNRRAGELAIAAAIEQAKRQSEQVAVLWIDLDRFKRINDQYGHGAGDCVLRTVGERISGLHSTAEAARMGGDEFLVLLRGAGAREGAAEAARRLETAIAQPIFMETGAVSVTASIGICFYPEDGHAIDALERNADLAMYRAKLARSGTCVYSPVLSTEAGEELELEDALKTAVDRNQLYLAYQPVFAAEGRLMGFEALLRFRHPVLGEVSPARFIPVAERTRVILTIGHWVIREVCRQLSTWRSAGLPSVRISINISALQFLREDFAESVEAILAEFEILPASLTFELTESVMTEDYSVVVDQMRRLRAHGIRIAMDDFGTGYSSLSLLHQLPIDALKIDRSFIERLTDVDGTRPIVEAILSMASRLGLPTVAEGVETEEQRRILQLAGCRAFQGYLFARPMTPAQASRYLETKTTGLLPSPYSAREKREATVA